MHYKSLLVAFMSGLSLVFLLSCSSDDDNNPGGSSATTSLSLTSPNGGENYAIGSTQTIRWTSSGLSETVLIELNRSYPSSVWESLASAAYDSGSFLWTVSGSATTQARLRISGITHTSVADTSMANFSISIPSYVSGGMVLVPARNRSFSMGSTDGSSDEQPVHSVNLSHDFWMDSTEVTQSDFDFIMDLAYFNYTAPAWHHPYGVGDQYPAYFVYWSDAALYCNARSKYYGLDTVYTYSSIIGTPGNLCELVNPVIDYSMDGYRLPTEAEWEFACRGGSDADYFWGKSFDPYPETTADSAEVNAHAIWFANAWQFGADSVAFGTHQVATTSPNAYRLYDMSGNLYEWCNDWYGDYSAAAASNPTGPTSGEWRCTRGGSWGSHAMYLRSSNRTLSIPDYVYNFIGFRVVLPVQ